MGNGCIAVSYQDDAIKVYRVLAKTVTNFFTLLSVLAAVLFLGFGSYKDETQCRLAEASG